MVLLFTDPIVERLVWLAESYRTAAPPLSANQVEEVRRGVHLWAWSGIILGAIILPLVHSYGRSALSSTLVRGRNRITQPLPLAPDRYGRTFILAVGGVLVFTALIHWSLTAYKDVDWFGGEDGVSEWWSVATYLAAAILASAAAWRLRSTGHPRLSALQLALTVVLVVGALEEISWGQRLFDWGTPQALASVNQQGETTLHNVGRVVSVIFSLFFWGSVVALAGGAVRAAWQRRGRVTSAHFVLPSLVLAPALFMILIWRVGDEWTAVSLPRLIMEAFDFGPQGSEVPEVLLGLCILVYTYSNFKRATQLPKQGMVTRSENARKPVKNRNSLISPG